MGVRTHHAKRTGLAVDPRQHAAHVGADFRLALFALDAPDVVAGNAQRDTNAVRSFVFRACVMHELFRNTPSLTHLLTALRYTVEIRKTPPFGELPLVTVSAPFRTFRPTDELVTLAAGLAGGQSFAEIIDLDSVHNLQDPLKDETIRLLGLDKTEGHQP